MATILQTSNIIWQSITLTDELKINLEYDVHRSALNIFVKNTGDNKDLSCQLNVLPSPCETKPVSAPKLPISVAEQGLSRTMLRACDCALIVISRRR
jgi:hypothetical protein